MIPHLPAHDVWQVSQRTHADVVHYQQQQLQTLLAHVWTHSAFYREYYSSHGIRDTNLPELDVRDLPFVTKQMLMEHFDTAVTDPRLHKADLEHWLQEHRDPHQEFHKDYIVCYSSGSSGTVGIFVYDRPSWQVMSSIMATRLPMPEHLGTAKTRVAFYLATHGHFAGISSTIQMSTAVYETLRLSVMDIPEHVIEQLQTFQPHRLVGYASSITALAEWALAGKLRICPSQIMVSAEPLTPSMVRSIKAAWDVPIHISYSASESLYIGLQNSSQPEMTLMDDLNVVEMLDEAQQPVAPGERGRVVLTNLYNHALPIIRYELGDYVVRGIGQQTPPFSTIRGIEGKSAAGLPAVMHNGAHDTIDAFGLSAFYVAGLHRVQFTSLRPDRVRIDYIAANDNDEAVRQEFWRILDIKGALRTTVEVRRVPYLPPDPKTGKVPLVKIEPQSGHPAVLTARPAIVVTPEHRRIGPTNAFIPFPKAAIEQSIPARFEQQVAQYPTHIAVKTGAHLLTYDALNRRANQLARAILAQQPASKAPIALLLNHGAPTITALLAVLKAGRSYVPLDPAAPQARLKALLEDTQAPLLIADTGDALLAAALVHAGCQVLNVDRLETALKDDNLGLEVAPDALAYILYTSGSTGQPKGVMQNHRNVLHNMMKYTNGSHICAEDRLSLLFSHSFSAAGTNIFGALLNGATLLPFNLQDRGLAGLATHLQEEGITVYHSVTTVFRHFVETLTGVEAFPHLRLIELTGESVAWSDVERYKQYFPPPCLLHNRLAATEMSLIRQYFVNHETPTTRGVVPVGYAVDDTEILLLDEGGNEVGCNCLGEMVIKSPYLAVGYWRQPELTRLAFLPDPVGGAARLYRTGDLGLLQPDGCLEHHGRKDFRVKIRGHRLEVGEVETALLSLAGVKAAIVVAREDRPGDPHLVAYLVPATPPVPTVGSIRRALAATLPDYMIPAVFVWLEALPLTASGKVNRRALPAPGQVESTAETVVDSPRTPVEEIVARIWSEVLSRERVSIHDHFFDLGGHSLLAMQLLLRVHDRLQVEVPLRTFFAAPTVAAMAEIIVQQQLQHITPEALEQILADTETLEPPS